MATISAVANSKNKTLYPMSNKIKKYPNEIYCIVDSICELASELESDNRKFVAGRYCLLLIYQSLAER